MNRKLFCINPEVKNAIDNKKPIVALESTVITHGLPYPLNFETAQSMENAVSDQGAIPATIALIKGKIMVGLKNEEMDALARPHGSIKISPKDLAGAYLRKDDGGTTVAATLLLAYQAGIHVFATGGIGGIHRGQPTDISADLPMLSRIPMVVVSSGAKAILDLPATREYLETHGIPVIGYKNNEMAAFYSGKSGLKADFRAENASEIAQFAKYHWELGNSSAVLVTISPPKNLELDFLETEKAIITAINECEKNGIKGSAVTPYLLAKMAEITNGESVRTNTALLINNASIAAEISNELTAIGKRNL